MLPDRIIEIAYSYRAAKALMSAVELDLFTILSDGPLASEDTGATCRPAQPRGPRFSRRARRVAASRAG